MRHLPRDTDVLVVGGGPAGLAAALAARQAGLAVVVADRARPPIDKACGEGLMPDGIAALRRLGVRLDGEGGMPFRGIRFIDGALSAEAAFAQGDGLGMRRTDLHRVLVRQAAEVGVVTYWQRGVEVITADAAVVGGETMRCRWIVGADGISSRVRHWSGITPAWLGRRRIGLRQHFRVRPWTDHVEVYWHHGRQAYVTPVAPDEICIALMADEHALRFADLPQTFPELARRLGSAMPAGSARGAASMSAQWQAVISQRIALIGDASGSVDAITGEGMALAFRQAVALGPALARGGLAGYAAAHRRMGRLPQSMARLLLYMGRHDSIRRGTLRLLAYQPRIFDKLLATHVGGLSPASAG
jgi:2-polyprenyl-6-methoxyphenol hydroxylase-like FAD-dependent oxidoreductase